ncbi:MAG: ATP-binding protein [Candidatus Peribacteraceae bacterium]|nr:ATP-binding protein [Candidatus Peribacteraceae bacterium]
MTKTPAPPKAYHPSTLLLAIDELLGLNRKAEDVLSKGAGGKEETFSDEDRTTLRHYLEGLQKILDIIAPSSMEVKSTEILLNDQRVRTLYAYNWPNYIFPNWLSQTINADAQMDIAQYIYPASNKSIMKMLRKKVAELRSSIRMLEQRGIVRDPALEAALQDAEELRDLLARGQEKLFQFGLYVTLYADDDDKLKKMQTDVESVLGGKLVLTKAASLQMEHGFTSTLPLCLDELEINRNMNTSPIATSFPFSSSDLTSDHGILYGINRHNESLVIFDRFDLPNANANIFAISGAGKSFTVKLEILRSLMMGTEVLVIDPENEYGDLCRTVGGTYIPLSLQSSFRVNPFDLPKAVRGEKAETGETLRAAVINLHSLFKLMLGSLTPSEDGVLDKAILDTYALKGITLEEPNPGSMEPPTLHDLVEVLLTTEGGENMAKVLQKFTSGSFAGLFDRQTNVELEKQLVVFQIRDLEEQLRPIAIFIVLNFLWNRVRSELKRRYLVIDEAWNLMQFEDSARFLFGIVKRARKYYLGITTITQDVEDFVNSPYGKPIITNSSLQVLLKQSATAVDNLQKLFYLTDGEKYVLLNSGIGQGIFFAGNKHVAIEIVSSPEEAAVVTTKPEEMLAKRATEAVQAREDAIHARRAGMEKQAREDKAVDNEKTQGEQTTADTPPATPAEEPTADTAPKDEPVLPETTSDTPSPATAPATTATAPVASETREKGTAEPSNAAATILNIPSEKPDTPEEK